MRYLFLDYGTGDDCPPSCYVKTESKNLTEPSKREDENEQSQSFTPSYASNGSRTNTSVSNTTQDIHNYTSSDSIKKRK